MTIETQVYKLLANNTELIKLLESLRKVKLGDESGIWKHDIPETYRKKDYAPFIRLSPIYEADFGYSDDKAMSEEQRMKLHNACIRWENPFASNLDCKCRYDTYFTPGWFGNQKTGLVYFKYKPGNTSKLVCGWRTKYIWGKFYFQL